jgi:hypothetical protein
MDILIDRSSARASFALLAALLTSTAQADLSGRGATVRGVSSGALINIFLTTNSASDELLSVDFASFSTNSVGGFLQGSGTQSVYAPSGNQSWTTQDSFLTVGGGLDPSSGAWTGNAASVGNTAWNVTYQDSIAGTTTVSAFSTPSNGTGFANPFVNTVPVGAGWNLAGGASPARSLSGLQQIWWGWAGPPVSAQYGFMIAQLHVQEFGWPQRWVNASVTATVRRSDGTTMTASYFVTVPGPSGAGLLLGLAFRRRRRRAKPRHFERNQ